MKACLSGWRIALVKATLLTLLLGGCSQIEMPKIALPKIPEIALKKKEVHQTTPRALLSARIVNTRYTDQVPKMTVGKLIEFAERGFSCSCRNNRFVKSWVKTSTGYKLTSNAKRFSLIEFSCQKEDGDNTCFVNEIESGTSSKLADKYISGDDFIKTIYSNGRVCKRQEACPN